MKYSQTVAGSKALLIDLKGSYHAQQNLEFAQALVREIREHRAERWVAVCGQFWPVLEDVRKEAPDIEVRYSVERVFQWEKFMRLVGDDERVRKSLHRAPLLERGACAVPRGPGRRRLLLDGGRP